MLCQDLAVQTRATSVLGASGIEFSEHAYHHDPAADSFGLEAAEALGLEPDVVFKTLIVQLDGTGGPFAVGVVPVHERLDLKALARVAGAKRASMADVPDAERVSGYVAGGISPIGMTRDLPTFIDESALICDRVYISGGQRGFDIGLEPSKLVGVLGATVAALCTASNPRRI